MSNLNRQQLRELFKQTTMIKEEPVNRVHIWRAYPEDFHNPELVVLKIFGAKDNIAGDVTIFPLYKFTLNDLLESNFNHRSSLMTTKNNIRLRFFIGTPVRLPRQFRPEIKITTGITGECVYSGKIDVTCHREDLPKEIYRIVDETIPEYDTRIDPLLEYDELEPVD